MGVEKGAGIEERDAECLNLGSDGAENGLGVAAFEGEKNFGGLEVGMEALEEAAGGDLAGHERGAGAKIGQRPEHFSELADFEDAPVAFGKRSDEVGRGLALESDES